MQDNPENFMSGEYSFFYLGQKTYEDKPASIFRIENNGEHIEELDRILPRYEESEGDENFNLLLSHFKPFNANYDIQCELIPDRTISHMLILQSQLTKLVCSKYE